MDSQTVERSTGETSLSGNAFKFLSVVARVLIGGVLIIAAISKLAAPKEEFALIIQAYNLVSPSTALTMATFLPWVELLIGYSLLTGYALRLAAAASGVLFIAFDFALLSLKVRGIQLPSCGCFGASFHPEPKIMIGVDFTLIILSLIIFKVRPIWALDSWAGTKENHGS